MKKILTCLLFGITFFSCFKAKRAFWDSSSPQGLARNLLVQELNKTQITTPTFSPAPGVVTTLSNITINTTTSGTTIYYTTDGTNPTTSSTVYNSPLENVWSLAGKTIKAFAVKNGMLNSSIVSGIFSYPPLKTGQTGCWDSVANSIPCAGSGHDGQYQSGVNRSYTDNGDGTVTDNATGLVWQKCSRGQNNDATCSGTATITNWTEAGSYCSGLSLASRTWRLPTRQEIETLPDYDKNDPAIDTTVFPSTVANWYWSSDICALNTTSAWFIDFFNGGIGFNDKTNPPLCHRTPSMFVVSRECLKSIVALLSTMGMEL